MQTTHAKSNAAKPAPLPSPSSIAGRVPPHDLDAEAVVLSAMLLERDAVDRVLGLLKREHFYSDANGRVFEAIADLHEKGIPIDITVVAAWLRDRGRLQQIGGPSYLAQLTDATPAVAHVEQHATIVYEKWRARQIIATCQRVAAEGYGGIADVQAFADQAEQAIFDVARARPKGGEFTSLNGALKVALTDLTRAREVGDAIGIPMGFERLDELLGGLFQGDLIVMGARPGMGKTALALSIALNVAQPRLPDRSDPSSRPPVALFPGYGVCIASLEMPREQLALRLTCQRSRINVGDCRRGDLTGHDLDRMFYTADEIKELPIWIDDTAGMDIFHLRSFVRRSQALYDRPATATSYQQRVGLVIVDYIQLMKGRGTAQNREQEIAEISRELKQLAKDLRVTVIALSQLNRSVESRADKRPQLADLRESGAIEQDADAILFVYRDEYYTREASRYKGLAEIDIAKQRNGGLGRLHLRFQAWCARFEDVPKAERPPMEVE
jgi:replicative DNA helicase